jgi:hypothetical protein
MSGLCIQKSFQELVVSLIVYLAHYVLIITRQITQKAKGGVLVTHKGTIIGRLNEQRILEKAFKSLLFDRDDDAVTIFEIKYTSKQIFIAMIATNAYNRALAVVFQ